MSLCMIFNTSWNFELRLQTNCSAKSCGGRSLWNRNWDFGWIWTGLHYILNKNGGRLWPTFKAVFSCFHETTFFKSILLYFPHQTPFPSWEAALTPSGVLWPKEARSHFIYHGKTWNGKRYPSANGKKCHLDTLPADLFGVMGHFT